MKQIKLTQGKYALVDDEDFEYLNQFHWSVDGSGYPQRAIKINGKHRPIRMHRDILKLNAGEHADHINHDKLDNKRTNLRKCTQQENNRNMPMLKTNTSGYRGVYEKKDKFRNNKWVSEIHVNNKKIHLGLFKTPEDAAQAYNKAAQQYFGEFARLNIL